MCSQKLFITGGTVYIGGSVLAGIVKRFPDLQVSALLRSESQEFTGFFPKVEVILGDLASFEVIEKATQNADITIHAGKNNHQGCVNAILSGLSKKTTPSFLIHLTGTGTISDRLVNTWERHSNPRVCIPPIVDEQINEANTDLIKTAMICPTDIYGKNTGPGQRATYLVPEYIKVLLKKKESFYLGKGENLRSLVHIQDVVDAFLLLVDNAVRGGGEAQWGLDGFYFVVTSEAAWKDIAVPVHAIGIMDGWLPADSEISSWTKEQVATIAPGMETLFLYIWGTNSRADSARLRKLGWGESGPTFWECVEEDVKIAVTDAMTRDTYEVGRK